MAETDLLIVGGGAAAFAAATAARDLDAEVTMINDGPGEGGLPLGGTCVNVGCVPSKFLLEGVDDHHEAQAGRDGWLTRESSLDYAGLKRAKDGLVETFRKQNYQNVLERIEVSLVEGRARFVGERAVAVDGERYAGDRVLIATGARTDLTAAEGLAEADPLTNVTALELDEVPDRLGIVGAGPQGVEFAQIFARAGSEVELFGRVLPSEEPSLGKVIADQLASEDVHVHAGERVERVKRTSEGTVRLEGLKAEVEVDEVLAATGIQPNTDDLGLDKAGVETDAAGFVETDEHQATTAEGVLAAGDVTGRLPLETTAAKQGYNAARNALNGDGRSIDYEAVPHAVFSDPELASVGWTEEEQLEETGTCWCVNLPLENVPRAHAAGDTRGLVRLVADPDTREIKGAHAVAKNASEIIHLPTMAIRAGWTLDDLIDTVHVFPTYAEAWKLCAQAFDRDVDSMSCCIV